ncbi:transcription initiation factor TFIID subunit 7, partial [Tanacetum coccineum]
NGRRCTFTIGGDQFPASLFDLPCIVESHKTYDDNILSKLHMSAKLEILVIDRKFQFLSARDLYSSATSSLSGCGTSLRSGIFVVLAISTASSTCVTYEQGSPRSQRCWRPFPLACAIEYGHKEHFRGAYSIFKLYTRPSLTGHKQVAGRYTRSGTTRYKSVVDKAITMDLVGVGGGRGLRGTWHPGGG